MSADVRRGAAVMGIGVVLGVVTITFRPRASRRRNFSAKPRLFSNGKGKLPIAAITREG